MPSRPDHVYAVAVESTGDHPARAAQAAWSFLRGADPDDPRYDRAQRLLAAAAEDLGLSFAAGLLYRDIARARRDVSLLPDAIAALERLVLAGTYDRDGWLDAFLAADDFGVLPEELTGFVAYHRGLDLVRRGEDAWAEPYFVQIPPTSPWQARLAYLRAVRSLADGDDDAALAALEALDGSPDLPADVRADTTRTLARLAYERERFDEALVRYERLRERASVDAALLLEMAWTSYWLGDARRALGLLVAMDAPVHRGSVQPERYVLEALALRRLCQYEAARGAAGHLRARHGETLQALRTGVPPHAIPELRAAARAQAPPGSAPDLVARILSEREDLAALRLHRDVRAHFDELYARGLERARGIEARVLPDAAAHLAEALLAADEGTQLVVHELGVAMSRGRRRPDGVPERPERPVPVGSAQTYFRFDGEYWTDELGAIVMAAEDRCLED